MLLFRLFMAVGIIVIGGYTAVTIGQHGMGLLPLFFGDIARMTWAGQFNLDFLFFLLLSGLWVAWRNSFRPVGLLLGLVAVFGGSPFLFTYLLILTARSGDIRTVLLGPDRARA